ncbi:MAG: hypothetical protein RMJ19_05905 [Gemmatales bacterium]|nr:hypothetical protein [Gemmatales bacterium]MCS7159987.1 hypothetical protein [Gemmatales bacterium]MDW8175186.1 hypothetical protein [Gemmatales bacterium]MDW8223433.1 hypothetical protein [Gemmatales bacterium]
MFTSLTSILLTASTALVCAAAVAARPSTELVILAWLIVGAIGGFCAGLGFSWLVGEIRTATLPASSLNTAQAERSASGEGTWDFVYASGDLGWTLGVVSVMVLDASRVLITDEAYLWAAGIPVLGALLTGLWAWWRGRFRVYRVNAGRTALALLVGLMLGFLLVQAWAGLQLALAWIIAAVTGVHLAVSLATLVNLAWADAHPPTNLTT